MKAANHIESYLVRYEGIYGGHYSDPNRADDEYKPFTIYISDTAP